MERPRFSKEFFFFSKAEALLLPSGKVAIHGCKLKANVDILLVIRGHSNLGGPDRAPLGGGGLF